jgi:glycosyltransferase involved in cell wall biosynthesis
MTDPNDGGEWADDTRVGVVVPAYDEAAFVGEVVDSIPAAVERIYAVDDGSSDGTWDEIRARAGVVVTAARPDAASEERPVEGGQARVVGVRHDTNYGRGAAVVSGYRRALADGLDVVAVLDGDGQMDPAILDRIVEPVVTGEADYAKGTRLTSPEDWRGMSGWRLFGNLLLTGLTRVSSGYWQMTDPQNGYTAISAAALEAVDFERLYAGYGFLNDLLTELNVAGMRVANVPMRAVYGAEESGIAYRSFVPSVSLLLLQNFLWRLWADDRSVPGYAVVGLYALGGVGLLAGSVAVGASVLAAEAGVGTVEAGGTAGVGLVSTLTAMAADRRRNAPLEFIHATGGGSRVERPRTEGSP